MPTQRRRWGNRFDGNEFTDLKAWESCPLWSVYAKGMDFADALHLCTSAGDDEFKTFYKRCARKAAALGLSPSVSVV